jgi:hypothetical protein
MGVPAGVEDVDKSLSLGKGFYGIIEVLIGFPAAADHPSHVRGDEPKV